MNVATDVRIQLSLEAKHLKKDLQKSIADFLKYFL